MPTDDFRSTGVTGQLICFEKDNIQAYVLLLRIENILRELIRATAEETIGPEWRNRLPGDLLKKIREAQREENKPQFNYLCMGPLYYLTFGELISVLKNRQFNVAITKLGGNAILAQIENVCNPRNAVCHSRHCSKTGLVLIESLYEQIVNALTPEYVGTILQDLDVGIHPEGAAPLLAEWLFEVQCKLESLERDIPLGKAYEETKKQYWWGNKELAGFECGIIDDAVKAVYDYNALSKGIGSRAYRQRFSEDRGIDGLIQNALNELKRILP